MLTFIQKKSYLASTDLYEVYNKEKIFELEICSRKKMKRNSAVTFSGPRASLLNIAFSLKNKVLGPKKRAMSEEKA